MPNNFYTKWQGKIATSLQKDDPSVAISSIIAGILVAELWVLTFLTITAFLFWIVVVVSIIVTVV